LSKLDLTRLGSFNPSSSIDAWAIFIIQALSFDILLLSINLLGHLGMKVFVILIIAKFCLFLYRKEKTGNKIKLQARACLSKSATTRKFGNDLLFSFEELLFLKMTRQGVTTSSDSIIKIKLPILNFLFHTQ